MKQDKQKTKVLFLIEKGEIDEFTQQEIESGDVFAYFPDLLHSNTAGIELKTCYAHVGQHSACHPDYANECRQANFNQYQDLLKELVSIGYNLEVMNDQEIEYRRKPTAGEIKFGEGATHYRDFKIGQVLSNKGHLKEWFVADDNLRYYR